MALGSSTQGGGQKQTGTCSLAPPAWHCGWAGGAGWQSPTPRHPCFPRWTALSSASSQDERFKAHDHLEHQHLLWYSTSVAMVAAILKSRLRIMPHLGGHVGKGIYLRLRTAGQPAMVRVLGQTGMPAGSVRTQLHLHTPCQAAVAMPNPFPAMAAGPCVPGWPGNNQVGMQGLVPSSSSPSPMAVSCTSEKAGIMFLTEVALGKPCCITCDDPTLCQPPASYDSILVCGRTEPDEPGAGVGVGSVGLGWA